MHKFLSLFISCIFAATTLGAITSTHASPPSMLTTCTDLETGKTLVLRNPDGKCRTDFGSALWVKEQADSAFSRGDGYAVMTVCSSRNPRLTYKLIKNFCPKYQVSTNYWRTVAAPSAPIIKEAIASGYNTAVFTPIASKQAIAAPIVHYLITNIKTGQVDKASLNNYGELLVSNLSPLTSYTFTVSAVNVDGTSPASTITPVIRTSGVPIAAPATPVITTDDVPLAAPAFTLSASAETVPVNTAATGFTPSSTGGAIASYAISPSAPAGLTFNTATGILSGTPSSTQSATAYTITATNATGSATRTFTLTVTAIVYSVGDTGPGGGTIFYVATTPFACGPTLASSCTYLEAAPALWFGEDGDPTRTWAQSTPVDYQLTGVNNATSPETATATAIGWGYRNTRAIILQGNTDTATSAAALADSHTVTVSGVVYDDWYLPSKDELNQMCKWVRNITGVALTTLTTVCTGGTINTGAGAAGFVEGIYWSSSEYVADFAWVQYFNVGGQSDNFKDYTRYVRPVRAF